METAIHPRFAVPKALEFKAFPVLNVLRCAADWRSLPSVCAGCIDGSYINRAPAKRSVPYS